MFSDDKLENLLSSSKKYFYADYQYELIMEEIKEFENSLDDNHEIALQLCNFGQNIILNVTEIGYCNPNLILFYGTVNGKEAQLIQHINQISFLLLSVEKKNPSSAPKRIGFQTNKFD